MSLRPWRACSDSALVAGGRRGAGEGGALRFGSPVLRTTSLVQYSVLSLPRYAQLVLNLEDISIPASGQLPYWFVWGREEGGEDYEVHRAVPSGPGHRFLHGGEISSFSTFSIPVSSLCPIHIQHSAHYVCITLYTVRSSSCPPSKHQRLVSILPPSPPPRLPSTKKSERGVVEPLVESHAKRIPPPSEKSHPCSAHKCREPQTEIRLPQHFLRVHNIFTPGQPAERLSCWGRWITFHLHFITNRMIE